MCFKSCTKTISFTANGALWSFKEIENLEDVVSHYVSYQYRYATSNFIDNYFEWKKNSVTLANRH